MKYMGSKKWMLANGLGAVLNREAAKAKRFVDLFSGSGAVASYVAQETSLPVLAFDLQRFSAVLSGAVIHRKKKLASHTLWMSWVHRARARVNAEAAPPTRQITKDTVAAHRLWSANRHHLPITKAYGGYYFSPTQSIWIDALRKTLPKSQVEKTLALASLIQGASQCAAAPGHTAQPLQPTRTAKAYLREAWNRRILHCTYKSLRFLAGQYATRVGRATVTDANRAAKKLRPGDLVFIDPPYSGVHYSRFYHVLESIAMGRCGKVEGVGRYPSTRYRPRSKYSVKSESREALDDLLSTASSKGATVVLTFPDRECSNGLSGDVVREIGRKYFKVQEKIVKSQFSTLGGNDKLSKTGNNRAPRQTTRELILVFKPRKGRPKTKVH